MWCGYREKERERGREEKGLFLAVLFWDSGRGIGG